jgi:hypothetical protein
MTTYEINVWRDKRIIEKVVRQFEDGDAVMDYIRKRWDNGNELPRLDQEKGYLRPQTREDIITWAKISTYIRKKGPNRIELTDEEKEVQGTLEKCLGMCARHMGLIQRRRVTMNFQEGRKRYIYMEAQAKNTQSKRIILT